MSYEFLVNAEIEEEKPVDEEFVVRMQYEKAYAEDYNGETIIADAISLSPMFSEEKISKAGNIYQSNKCILTLFNDEDEVQIPFYIENFREYKEEKDLLIVKGHNPLAKIVKKLSNDKANNKFTIKYDEFRNICNKIRLMKTQIYEYDRNGYTDYSIRVLGLTVQE